MSKSRKKKKKMPAATTAAIIVVAAIACIVYLIVSLSGPNNKLADQSTLFGLSDAEHAAILVNGQQLEEQALLADGTVYISYDTVWDSIDSGFYMEGETLYRTLPEGTYTWAADDGTGCLYKSGDTMYISAACLQEYADAEIAVYEDPSRVIVRSSWKDLQSASLISDAPLRVRSEKRSEIAVNLAAGDTVYILEAGEGWTYAQSADGHVGYVETASLGEATEVVQEEDARFRFDAVQMDGTVKMVWHYIDSVENNAYLDGMMADVHGINVISPTWFKLSDAQGNLTSCADQTYMDKAKNTYGLAVWALVGDYAGEDSSTGEILSSAENRARCIAQLMEAASAYGFDGINIDFETITYDQAPAYLQFLRELTAAAHAQGLIVSTDNYVPTYTGQYKRSEQAKIVDYMIMMGYDEHTYGSEEAGSVASLPFVEQGVADTLAQAPAEKVILAVPFYSRGWTQPFGLSELQSEVLNMGDQQAFMDAHGITPQWDDSVGQYVGTGEDSEASYSIWVEDAKSIGLKLDLVSEYSLAGASAWRVGTETSDVWDVWEEKLG